ncbi:AGAP013300-PA-like protein [Anopheles sinensis]|uniref:AGAP013300-PA-like protein n=1 Tax=Anopheles sinensis TaxID=74873 RepID=A0A084VHG0_ANOSI|nr:AGAP013300-PA-like protein [Anopheles sinensis]
MNRVLFLFALLAVATAEPPFRFRSRAAFPGVQRPNARFARLEEQPQQQQPQPAEEQPSTGYHYPKPMSSGYHYPKPDQAFPLPGEDSTTEAAPEPVTTTAAAAEEPTTTVEPPASTTVAFEDYEESTDVEVAPTEATNAKLRRRPQQLNGPSPIRLSSFGPAQYRQQPQQYLLNQRLEQPATLPVATVDDALRPVYLINLPESTLQQLILLNSAQLQQQQQPLQVIPQPTAVYLSELDYIYKKK